MTQPCVFDARQLGKTLSATLSLIVLMLVNACSRGGSGASQPTTTPVALPVGAVISGATLSGALAGRQISFLGGGLNRANCWQDSEYWDGTTLWFALTSTNWTQLSAAGTLAADPGCTLPADQTGTLFNVYGATFANGVWTLFHPSFNSNSVIAAPKISGATLVAVVYEKANSYGNIYIVTRDGLNSFGAPIAFSQNSTNCNDDNPTIYANGTKMIFESNRTSAAIGSACGTYQKLWSSSLINGTWSLPVALTGAPALGAAATQPWLDETTGKLYWTADNTNQDICPVGTANCVVEADPNGSGWSNFVNVLITPSSFVATNASDGQLVLVGQFTMANGFAVASCGIGSYSGSSNANLIGGHLAVYFNACVIPLN